MFKYFYVQNIIYLKNNMSSYIFAEKTIAKIRINNC